MKFPNLDMADADLPKKRLDIYKLFQPHSVLRELDYIKAINNYRYMTKVYPMLCRISNAAISKRIAICLLSMVCVETRANGQRQYLFPSDITGRCVEKGLPITTAWNLRIYSLNSLSTKLHKLSELWVESCKASDPEYFAAENNASYSANGLIEAVLIDEWEYNNKLKSSTDHAKLSMHDSVGEAYIYCQDRGGISSCMAHDEFESGITKFYKLFNVKCAVLEIQGVPMARCLFWTNVHRLNGEKAVLIDRIYTAVGKTEREVNFKLTQMLSDYAREFFPGMEIITYGEDRELTTETVTVDDDWYETLELPYVDSFCGLYQSNNSKIYLRTNGDHARVSLNDIDFTELETAYTREKHQERTVWSEYQGMDIPEYDALYVDEIEDYVESQYAAYDEIENIYILDEHSVVITRGAFQGKTTLKDNTVTTEYGDVIHISDAVETCCGEQACRSDCKKTASGEWIDVEHQEIAIIDDKIYCTFCDDVEEIDGKWTLCENIVTQ